MGLAELSEPLHSVSGALDKKQAQPILSHLLLQVSERSLSLLANDMAIQISSSCELDEEGEACCFTLPGRKFMDICRYMPDRASLGFEVKDNSVIVVCGQFRSQLMSLPAEQYPQTAMRETKASLLVSAEVFRQSLEQVMFAMASQDVRYFFNGMLLDIPDDEIHLVATNGQRLAMTKLDVAAGPVGQQAIIPRRSVLEVVKLLKGEQGQVQISLNEQQIVFRVGNKQLVSQLIDATYPDYRKAIPQLNSFSLQVNRRDLKAALARISICSNELYKNVKMTIDAGTLTVSASNPQQEDALEELSVDYQGESLEIGFNVSYLTDVLSAMSGNEVEFKLAGSTDPMLISDPTRPSAQYVISPMVI